MGNDSYSVSGNEGSDENGVSRSIDNEESSQVIICNNDLALVL